jgi:ribosomal protein S18 acetylase RimI-like enzyme
VLIAPGIALRPETEADEPFLRRLFIANRRAEFAALRMGEAELDAFLGTQFDLQTRHFRTVFRDADWSIVERKRVAIGRLYVSRGMQARELFDIALLPQWSGQGIGGKLIDHVLREARAAGRAVALQVRPDNPARLLYARKGFAETGFDGSNISMKWTPPG